MATVAEQIQEIYIGLLGRAADIDGATYWENQITAGNITIDGVRANIVNSQPEYAAGLGAMTRTQAVAELYERMFERAPEDAGLTYWTTGEGSAVPIDVLVLALSNGASAADRLVLDNKTDAAEYYTANTTQANYTADGATASIDSVDSTTASVTASKTATDSGSQAAGTTFTLTTAANVFTGTDNNDTFNAGLVSASTPANDTMNLTDVLNGGAGSDTLNISVEGASNALGGASVTAIETINVRAVTGAAATINAASAAGVTAINSDQGAGTLAVTGLATDAAIGVIGNGSVVNGAVTFAYATATDAVTLNVSGGTKIGTTVSATAGAATTATINSTGAANTIGALDLSAGTTLTALNVNATTDLTATLTGDYAAAGAALTVTGAGAVNLGSAGTFKTIDASAASGGLTVTIDTVTTSVIGSTGNDVITSASTTATTAGLVDAGDGTDTLVLAANVATAAEGAEYVNFETLSVSNGQDVSLIAGITALEVTGGNAALTKLTATQAAAITYTANQNNNSFALADASGTADAITLNLASATAATNVDATALDVDGFETMTINATTGTAGTNSSISFNSADKLTALNIAGTADVALAAANLSKAVTVISTTTGDVSVSGNFVDASSITTGAGDDAVTLGTGFATYNTGAGDDTINATAAQLNTAAQYNTIDGGADTDTLNITGGGTLTLVDNNLSKISGIEKIVVATTTTNDQNITTGGFFNIAFQAAGVDLTTTSSTGNIVIDMNSFTGATTLASTTAAGNSTITTGTGSAIATVTTTSTTGNAVITTGTGADVIAITASGAAAHIVISGAGDDTITFTGNTATATVTGGAGADVITLGAAGAAEVVVIGNTDSGITLATADTVKTFTSGEDSLQLGSNGSATANTGNYVESSSVSADFATALAAANVALSTLAGTSAASELYSFQADATNGYLFNDTDGNGVVDQVVVLTGITAANFAHTDIIA